MPVSIPVSRSTAWDGMMHYPWRTFIDTLGGLIAPRSRLRISIAGSARRGRRERFSPAESRVPGRSCGRVMYSWDRQCGGHVGYRSQLDRTRCWPSPTPQFPPTLRGPIMKRWRGHKTSAPAETIEWLSAGNAKGLPAVNPGVKMSVTKCQVSPRVLESLPRRSAFPLLKLRQKIRMNFVGDRTILTVGDEKFVGLRLEVRIVQVLRTFEASASNRYSFMTLSHKFSFWNATKRHDTLFLLIIKLRISEAGLMSDITCSAI